MKPKDIKMAGNGKLKFSTKDHFTICLSLSHQEFFLDKAKLTLKIKK